MGGLNESGMQGPQWTQGPDNTVGCQCLLERVSACCSWCRRRCYCVVRRGRVLSTRSEALEALMNHLLFLLVLVAGRCWQGRRPHLQGCLRRAGGGGAELERRFWSVQQADRHLSKRTMCGLLPFGPPFRRHALEHEAFSQVVARHWGQVLSCDEDTTVTFFAAVLCGASQVNHSS